MSTSKIPMSQLPTSVTGRTAQEIALEAAHLAGGIQMARLHGQKSVTHKGRGNLVTDVDIQVEGEVLALFRREYPEFGLLAEESDRVEGAADYTWIVDPVDGTRNYVSGIPYFAVVIALAYKGEVMLGLTYDPVRQELFRAHRGGGAFLNDVPIRVSAKEKLAQCLVGFDMGYTDHRAVNAVKLVEALWSQLEGVRIMGSAALGLAYAAAGRFDIYFHHNLAPWDVACGLLLVREAGGVITDRQGNSATLDSGGIIATSTRLHHQFLEATEGLPWRSM